MKRSIALLTVVCAILAKQGFAQTTKQLPNIVFILADDLGYGDLSCFNKEAQISTPNVEVFASQGMMCTNAHSPSSVCTPTRYGILTGRYAFRSSLKKGVLGGYSPALIEEDRFTIADLAKNAGYTTAIIGKRTAIIPSFYTCHSPRRIRRGCRPIICLSDIMASLAHLTHQPLPQGAGPDSYDCWPLFSATSKAGRPLIIHHSIEGMFAIRKVKWKYVDGQGSGGWSPKDANDKAPGQLYDMEKDERQTTNLYDKYPEVVKELKELLEKEKAAH